MINVPMKVLFAVLLAVPVWAQTVPQATEAIEKKDDPRALAILRPLAEQGDAEAQYRIGQAYAIGEGVSKDPAEAAKWYRKSAELGFSQAQKALRSLASTGHAAAQNALGLTYENGWGTIQIDAEAVRWYRRAAERGYPPAQYNLGRMYSAGRGVVRNPAEALKWFGLAAEQGDADARAKIKAAVEVQRTP